MKSFLDLLGAMTCSLQQSTGLSHNSAGDAGLPVLAVSRQAAAKIFQTDLAGLAEIEKGTTEAAKGTGSKPRIANQAELKMDLSVDIVRHEVAATNVIGILDGSDPELKKEVIVLGAHYDHLGHGGEGSLAPKSGDIHHSADDNASGSAALLELARTFAAQNPRPKRTLVFIAFSGEEEGLLGSNYYVTHPLFPLANTIAMINMDMIGRMKDNNLIIGGVGTAQEWRDVIARGNVEPKTVAELANISSPGKVTAIVAPSGAATGAIVRPQRFELTLTEDGLGPSDHSSFYAKQVPVLFFWTGIHEDYHKPTDTADKINYVDEARIVGMVAQLVKDVDSSEKRPTYAPAKSESTGRSTGFRVYLGTIPNYAEASDGWLLDDVREDSPAAKAGLKAGDKIVKLAGRDVRNVYDYTYALGEMKVGQEYEVEIMRGGERVKLKLTPAARK
jgi:aminopeptidase YwaD